MLYLGSQPTLIPRVITTLSTSAQKSLISCLAQDIPQLNQITTINATSCRLHLNCFTATFSGSLFLIPGKSFASPR